MSEDRLLYRGDSYRTGDKQIGFRRRAKALFFFFYVVDLNVFISGVFFNDAPRLVLQAVTTVD